MILDVFERHKPNKEYFVGIDSDGTVFNSMELKHKNCFIGSLIRIFDLAPIAHEIHIVWNYVNIYSLTRGTNRFKALLLTFDHLMSIDKVKSLKNITIPNFKILKKWVEKSEKLSNDYLKKFILESNQEHTLILEKVLEWSLEVNRMVDKTVMHLPPMEGALRAMEHLKNSADLVVISNTPLHALNKDWSENNIIDYALYIGGQELGTKTEMLKAIAENKYLPEKTLIIGDAPGDLRAAQNINALFFPILPLKEEESWREFNKIGFNHFINNSYKGKYQNNQIEKFQSILNIPLPWKN